MNRLVIAALLLLSACGVRDDCGTERPITAPIAETPAERDARMAWFRDARFGLFIHWGLYAVPEGRWNGRDTHGEWIRTTAQIPLDTYDAFRTQFDPKSFDPRAWAALAREAGMNYVTITTKHHDGFCLFESDHTEFDITATPHGRDVMKDVAAAFRNEGLAVCWYHSIMDWHHPDYLPRREWETDRPTTGADMDRYVRHLHAQVTELLTRYGPIGVMWFDGEWESTWNHERGQALYDLCRSLQPSVIVNNRVDVGRGGMAGQTRAGGFAGDYGTPEQEIPATGLPGVDWESCMTMNGHWGWNAADTRWKSTDELIRLLCDVASKGGNFLLNVGPKPDGTFPAEAVERLKGIGAWMKDNAASIHGTRASLFATTPWGRSTTRTTTEGRTTVYLQLFDPPSDGRVDIVGLGTTPLSARILGGDAVDVVSGIDRVTLVVPGSARAKRIPVVALEFAGKPAVFTAPTIQGPAGDMFLADGVDIAERSIVIPAMDGCEVRATFDGRDPRPDGVIGSGTYALRDTTTVRVRGFRDGIPVTPIAERTFRRVDPRAGTSRTTIPGLVRESWPGSFKKLPTFDDLGAPKFRGVVDVPAPGTPSQEHVARRFSGWIDIPDDGVWNFELVCDDGGRLAIGGDVVVDHDGLHKPEPKTGRAALSKGKHRFELVHFNATGGEWLELRWARGADALSPIPSAAFGHDTSKQAEKSTP